MAGEREGFSLVELIIVIAIMAILIGVIALAVIPNIQRSRESKDLSALDGVLSGMNVAAANSKLVAGDFAVKKVSDILSGTTDFDKEVVKNIGSTVPTPNSTAASKNSAIAYCEVKKGATADAKTEIRVWFGTDSAVNPTDYDSNEASKFEVRN